MTKEFKAYSEKLGMSEIISFEELITNKTDFDEFDIYLQYLGFNDINDRHLFEGDVLELEITKDLMDETKDSFYNSNLGKYLQEHSEVTSIILEHVVRDILSLNYRVYQKINGELEYCRSGEAKILTSGEDSLFPRYLVQKGAKYIGNIIETPNLLKKKYIPQKKDILNFQYDSDRFFNFVILDIFDDFIKLQNLSNGKIVDILNNEFKKMQDIKYIGTISLENYIKDLYLYSKFFYSEEDSIEAYKKYFSFSEKDEKYLSRK